jgi:hypothetical protein
MWTDLLIVFLGLNKNGKNCFQSTVLLKVCFFFHLLFLVSHSFQIVIADSDTCQCRTLVGEGGIARGTKVKG